MKLEFKYVTFLFISYFYCLSIFAQTDTTIDAQNFKIIERYKNGKIRLVGQFATDCV